MSTHKLFSLLGALSLGTTMLFADSGAMPSFQVEGRVPADQISSAANLDLPDSVLDSLASGAIELRQQIQYDAARQSLRVVGFQVPPGADLPTAQIDSSEVLWEFSLRVADVQVNGNSVVLSGAFAGGSGPYDTGTDPTSGLVSFTFDASTSAAKFTGINVSLVGEGSFFLPTGAGRIDTGKPAAISAVAGAHGAQFNSRQFTIDGSASKASDGSALTYRWEFLPASGQTAMLSGADTKMLQVSLDPNDPFAYGDYTFRLTVKSAAGLQATDTVTVTVVNTSDN